MDEETLDTIAKVYELVVDAGVHKEESIKVAEAAKVIENRQRDINIAFMNELSIIFNMRGTFTPLSIAEIVAVEECVSFPSISCDNPLFIRYAFILPPMVLYKVWICREQRKGKDGNGCTMRKVKEEELLAEIAGKMGYDPTAEFLAEQFKQEVEKVFVGEQGIKVVRK